MILKSKLRKKKLNKDKRNSKLQSKLLTQVWWHCVQYKFSIVTIKESHRKNLRLFFLTSISRGFKMTALDRFFNEICITLNKILGKYNNIFLAGDLKIDELKIHQITCLILRTSLTLQTWLRNLLVLNLKMELLLT